MSRWHASNKAAGTDDISVQLLQLAKPAILGHVIFVLDLSLRQGAVPPALKDARVTLIFIVQGQRKRQQLPAGICPASGEQYPGMLS